MSRAFEIIPSRDLCASTATRRNDVGAAGDLALRRLCVWFSGRSIDSSLGLEALCVK